MYGIFFIIVENARQITTRAIVILLFTLSFSNNICFADSSKSLISADSLKIWDSLISRYMVINNQLAKHYAYKSLKLATKKSDIYLLTQAYYNLGRVYQTGNPEQAYSFFSTASKLAKNSNLNIFYPRVIYYMALINNNAYNNKDALILLDTCIRSAKNTKDFPTISLGLCLMGTIALEASDTLKAINLFDSAYRYADQHKCNYQKGIALGNIALLKKNLNEKIVLEKRALRLISFEPGSEAEYATLLANIGYAFENTDSSEMYNKAAIAYAEKYSLSHTEMLAYNNLAYAYLDKKLFGEAIDCLTKHAIPIALKLKDHEWLSNFYDSYSEIAYTSGNYKKATDLQKIASGERSKADLQYSSKQIRLLASIMELKQKDLEINNNKKTIIIQGSELSQIRLISTIIILLLLSSIIIIVLVFQRVKIKYQKKTIESARKLIGLEEAEKNRIAMEIHDNLGPFFQSVTISIEDLETLTNESRDNLINQLNDFWQKIRAITHRMNNRVLGQYTLEESITELTAACKSGGKHEIEVNIEGDLNLVDDDIKLHTYRIIQELLTNARKYALKGKIYLTISQTGSGLNIFYMDPGPGFDVTQIKGMGVSNIFERVSLMNGKALLETKPESMTSWDIFIPLKRKNEKKSDL